MADGTMRELTGKVEHNITVDQDLVLRDMLTARATVSAGAHFDVRGMVTGEIVLEQGGRVSLHGTLTGILHNHGGRVDVYGSITGEYRPHSPEAEIILHEDARVAIW